MQIGRRQGAVMMEFFKPNEVPWHWAKGNITAWLPGYSVSAIDFVGIHTTLS